jgi:3-methyladenine DNA glycosylase/8-oxoguanine DNA glycosylase
MESATPGLVGDDALTRSVDVTGIDLRQTLGPHRIGRADPTMRIGPDGVWRATLTPDGPGTIRVQRVGDIAHARAWGPGAAWLLDGLERWLGLDDSGATDVVAQHAVVAAGLRRAPGLRIGASRGIFHALVPAILGQRVTAQEALRQWASLCRVLGGRAPGPDGLRLPPAPDALARRPYFWFHRFGIERKRADAIVRAARHAHRLEEATTMALPDAYRRLTALPGLGPWTAAMVAGPALGDPDAVPVGDYHLPHMVSWNLAGEARGDDARMLELLAPYEGQRGRVLKLIGIGGTGAPRFGPRQAILPIAGW